jgi:hypothetical protein
MKISNPIHATILQQVNLFQLDDFDKAEFTGYMPCAYRNSETEAMDEIYRMSEHVLIHSRTGLRIAYLTTESYYGDKVEYTVFDCFVITHQNQKHKVLSIDLENLSFETTAGRLSFHALRNTHDEKD